MSKKKEMTYEDYSRERKEGQLAGVVPEWMGSAGYQMFVKKYQYQADHPYEQYQRIAKTLSEYAPFIVSPRDDVSFKNKQEVIKYWEGKFFEVLWKGYLACSTPVLSNVGTDRGLPISCSGGIPVGDSIEGFYDAYKEVALLSKHGFGTAVDLSNIRPRGASFKGGGVCTGVIPVVESLVQTTRNVSQGSQRRGAVACYLDIEHGDFYELVEYLEMHPDDLNVGWIVRDSFITKLQKGKKDAVKRFQHALFVKAVNGKGYFHFIDKSERLKPEAYVKNNLSVSASNLCVAPETKILTKNGYETISKLEGKVVEVWNGKDWSETTVYKTGENQKLLKVVTKHGYELECTPEHKFYTVKRYSKVLHEVRAKDLKKGDKLLKFDLPVIEGVLELPYAYANGFYTGDGCEVDGKQRLYFYGEKKSLLERCGLTFDLFYKQDNQDRWYGHTTQLKDKFFIPDSTYTIKSRLDWLAGLMDSDGVVVKNGDTQGFQIGSVEKEFLVELQLMLQTLGVSSKVTMNQKAGMRPLPANDGTGENKLFMCKNAYRLLIGNYGLTQLQKLGLNTTRLKTTNHEPNRECSHYIQIESVEDPGRYDDTYCFTEPKRHMGMFNGILTGQCSEIMLHSDENETYICCLSWMNLAKYDEWKNTDAIYVATVFLDCIISYFIDKAKDIKGLEKAVRSAERGRPLGLGVGGFATLLQQRMIDPESIDAHVLNTEIFKKLHDESLEASKNLAEVEGEPLYCKGLGLRNTHTVAVAPTKSTALIYGGVSEGCMFDVAMSFTQSTPAGEVARVNPTLLALIKSKGLDVEQCIADVHKKKGSVQHVSWLTPSEKKVFKTAFEINKKVLLRLASSRQKWICQGQSLNLAFDSKATEEEMSEIYQMAFNDPNTLAIYYQVGMRGLIEDDEQPVLSELEICESCQ